MLSDRNQERDRQNNRGRALRCGAGVLGLALLGIAATPAHAETIRSQQWHLTSMAAEKIWAISKGEGVTVALIDTGVTEVPELTGRLVGAKDFPGADSAKNKTLGTVPASAIAGTGRGPGGRESAFGLAPKAKVMPLNITDGVTGEGSLADQVDAVSEGLAPALRHAADSPAKIISISVSLGTDEGSVEVDDAVSYALSKGKLIFAAVGDADYVDDPPVGYPARLPGVVGVGAVDKKLTRVKTSAVGPEVDVVAPGADVIGACSGGTGLCTSKGTHVATALAAAAAALVWSKHPDWTRNQVLRVLLNTINGPAGGEVRSDYIGYGALRPLRALKTPGDPGDPDEFPMPDLRDAMMTPSPSTPTPTPTPIPSASQAVVDVAAVGGDGHSAGFWIALGVSAAGLLCVTVGTPLLVAERRRSLPS
ncbi:S8 family serine peptidase [Streptomyces lateritius]|uniref:S8 family serine peptidase n=1 Tax=Streptomyces lateritius TaxID=67313 RepID=A0ABW6YF12_9ACTN